MSRLKQAIDASRWGEAVQPQFRRSTGQSSSDPSAEAGILLQDGKSRLKQAIDASRRGEAVQPSSSTPSGGQPHPSQPAAVPPSPEGEGFAPAGGTGNFPRSAAQTARDDAAERLWRLETQDRAARTERAAHRRGGSRYMGGRQEAARGGSRYIAGSDNYGVGAHAAEIKDLKDEIREENYNDLIQQGYRPMSLLDATWRSLNQGYLNTRYGEELYRELGGHKNDKQKFEDQLDSEEYRYVTDNPFLESISGASQLLGQQLRQFTNPKTAAMAATGAGAAFLAGQAGPQALLPEETVTVPSGFFGGLKTGMALNNYQVEAGLSYNELLENGVSPETARKIALGVGTVNAALEVLQIDELLDAFDILKVVPGTRNAAGRIAQELLKRGIDVAKETVQEVAQEGVTIAGTQLGSRLDRGEWAYDSGEVLDRLADTAKSSALSFGIMNLPAGGRNIAGILRSAKTENGQISGKTADRILADREAVAELEQAAGQVVRDNMTQSQKRAAVKDAVAMLAGTQDRDGRQSSVSGGAADSPFQKGPLMPAGGKNALPDAVTASEPAQNRTHEMTRQAPRERTQASVAYDAARLERSSSALGESGQKALNAAYDGRTDAQRYYGGFAAYYQAGVSGQDINKVNSDYGKYLTQAQRYAAYTSGQNDAALSLKREKQAARFAPVAGEKSGLVYDDFVREAVESGRTMETIDNETRTYLTAETAERVNTLAKDLGVRVRFVDSVAGGMANAQINGSEVLVERNNPNPVMAIVGHELTHRMQQLAPEEYRAFRNIVMREEGQDSRVQQRLTDYARQGVTLDTEAAMDEVAADYAGRMLDDGKVLDDFIQKHHDNRTLLEKLRDAFRALWEKLTGREKRQAGEAERKLTAALEAAAAQAEQNRQNAAQTEGGEARYSINEQFGQDIREWSKEGRPAGERFTLGTTGPVLQGLGAIESDIYMNGDKISTILEQHPEMTLREIQRIPELLEDPVLVLKSRNAAKSQYGNSRLVMFGSIKAQDGRPVMCVLDLRPTENGFLLDDMQKVTSAYTKDTNPVNFIQHSEILYADKKRTVPLLRNVGFTRPASLLRSGSMGSISYNGKSVNLTGEKFSDVVEMGEDMLEAASRQASVLEEQEQQVELSDVNTRYSLRKKDPPKKTGIAYKVFLAKDGKLYPPMVANPGGAGTPVGVWLDADIGQSAPPSKTGRAQVQGGGKGTAAGKISLAFRPGWHLGDIPLAKQFARKNLESGIKDLFPADFVWAECEYAMDVDYQEEAMSYGYTENGKFRHSYAGLPKLPTDGYYRYRTNPNPDTVPWIITGAMRVKRILTDAETDAICREHGVKPMARQGGPIDLAKYGLEAGDTTDQTRFSLKSPVEETKDLLALHNLNEEQLLGDLSLGGLPMPSIAIVKSQSGHTKYGDISLVFSKDSIDPKLFRSNKVYGGDAWTPTFPAVEYDVDRNEVLKVRDRIYKSVSRDILSKLGSLGLDVDNLTDKLNRNRGDIAQAYQNDTAMKYAYLMDIGAALTLPTKEEQLGRNSGHDNRVILALYNELGPDLVQELRNNGYQGYKDNPDIVRRILDTVNRTYAEILGEGTVPLTDKLGFGDYDRLVADTARYADYGYGNVGTEIDRSAAKSMIDDMVNQEQYAGWLRDVFSGIIRKSGIRNERDTFTPSGNRRSFDALHYEATLENIVKVMRNDIQKGGNAFMGGGQIWGVATRDYGSVAEIKADSSRLGTMSEEEYQKLREEYSDRLAQISNEIKNTSERNSFIAMDEAAEAIVDTLRTKKTVSAIDKELRTYRHLNIKPDTAQKIFDLVQDIRSMPTEYFEAKPQRAVGFDEVLAAVIPDSASQELRSGLSDAGVRTLEYKAGDDVDRLAKVNSVEGARFSLKTDSQGRELTKEQREFFRDSKVVDADGRLKVMYRGGDGSFTVFDRRRSSYSNLYGRGFYFTDSESHAGQYGDVRKFYLNITSPLSTAETTITKPQLRRFLEAVAENEEDYSFENYGQGATVDSVLASVYGKSDFSMLSDINQTAIGDMVAAVELFNEVNGTGFDGLILPTETVVFSPEQIKNTDNRAPTDNPDIRYSLKEGTISKSYEALLRENDALRERVDYWKGQTKRTERITTDKKAVEQAARALIRDYGAQVELENIRGDLQSLYDYIASGYDGKDELTYTEARRRAENIAVKLVENAVAVEDSLYQDYQDLRKHLRNIKLTISETDSRDIQDFNDFRKRNFGRLNIGKGRTNIDQVYQELAETWPGLFDEQQYSNPADQIYHIAQVLDTVGAVNTYNPFSGDMRNAVAGAANEIMERFFDLPQTRATFADRQARRLENAKGELRQRLQRERVRSNERLSKLREQNREQVQRSIERERAVRERQLQRLKDHYAQVQQNRAERQADSGARTRLLKIAKRLQNKKLPAVNRALLDHYIGDLDTTAKSMTGKTLERLSELRDWYAEQKENDPDFIADPAIEKELERLSKRQIGDMTAEEVADLTRVLLNIENELRTKRQLIDSEDRRDVYLQGVQAINDIENSGGNKEGGVMGAIDKYIVTETLSPLRQIKRMAGYVKNDPLIRLTEALADGQRSALSYQMEAERPFRKWAEDKKFSRDFSGAQARQIAITGLVSGKGPATVEITPAMRASLYLHSLNDQNLRHIREGGITVPDRTLYRKGKIAEAYARGTTIKLTPSQVRSITANMTAEEKAFARAVHDYFNGQSRDRINEVSEKLKGYSIAQVENYFPINTDTGFTRSDFETLKFDGTLEGMGFLKDRQAKASNPIYLRDVNDVLQRSIDQHSRYVGLAIPVRNFNKVWGVTKSSFNDDGSRNSYEGSVQKAVKKAWGESGYNYVEKMMTDLQGGGKQKNVWTRALNRIRSSYAGAVLTLNASVAMKQAASYPTAAAVLGWGPLAKAMKDVGKVDLDLIARYTPLQWYRSKGFSTKELGDLRQAGGPIAKVMNNLPPALNWVQGADLLTTRKLWKASGYYVKANNKDLAPGTDAYYRAVADVYNRVIEETQPNYTTMQRPQLLRSDDTLLGNLAMFKTQPFQNFNILYDAAGEYIAAKKNGVDVKTARKNLGNAVTSQLVQLAVFAGMTMAWAMFRGKREKYEDEDGEMSLQSVASTLGKDMIGGQLSTVPFGADAWELVSSRIFGDQYYGMDAVTVTAISDTIGSLNGMGELIGSTLKSAAAGEDVNWNSARIKLDGYMDDISKAAGVPYENVVNLFNAGYRHTCIAALGKYRGEYAALKLTADPEKKACAYYDLLYKAMERSPEQYDAIYRDMVDSGSFPADKISGAMETRMKDAQGVEKVSELDQRYLPPDQELEYSRMRKEISETEVWRSATAQQRSAAEEDLYSIVSGSKSGEKLAEKISGGAPYGIDETDYILYRLALRISDQPTESGKLGTYTNAEVEEAINMLSGLSDEARGYLWEAQGKSEKSNPYS